MHLLRGHNKQRASWGRPSPSGARTGRHRREGGSGVGWGCRGLGWTPWFWSQTRPVCPLVCVTAVFHPPTRRPGNGELAPTVIDGNLLTNTTCTPVGNGTFDEHLKREGALGRVGHVWRSNWAQGSGETESLPLLLR